MIQGVRSRISWSHPRLFEPVELVVSAVGNRLARFNDDEHHSSPELRIDLEEGEKGLDVSQFVESRTQLDRGITLWRGPDQTLIQHPVGYVLVDDSHGVGHGRFNLNGDVQNREVYLTVLVALTVLLRRQNRFVVHAGAAVHPEKGAYLFAGDSGSGKSTLVYSLVSTGWGYVSDDSILLSAADHVTVHPFRRDFYLSRATGKVFPELNQFEWKPSPFDPDKMHVNVDALFPDQRVDESSPSAILFPVLANTSTTKIESIQKTEALLRMLPQSGIELNEDRDTASRLLSILGSLIDQSRCYRLYAGRDILDDPARVAELLP